jgi:hypothetical protein
MARCPGAVLQVLSNHRVRDSAPAPRRPKKAGNCGRSTDLAPQKLHNCVRRAPLTITWACQTCSPMNHRVRNMYLVELKPGKEELYRTSDELALAIRNGDVDARSRVYHRATAKWISITLHPQYRAIVSAAKDDPHATPARRPWSVLTESTGQVLETTQATIAQASQQLHRWRRPIALGLSGILLLSGMQFVFPKPLSASS